MKTTNLRSTTEFKDVLSKKAEEVRSRIETKSSSNTSVSPMKSPGKVCLIIIFKFGLNELTWGQILNRNICSFKMY